MSHRDRVPRSLRAFAWYPLLIVASGVLGLFVAIDVSPFAMFRPLVIALAGVAVVQVLLSLLLRDPDRGGIATFVAILGLLWWGDARLLGLLALLIVVVILLERLPRRVVSPVAITTWFTVFSSVLLVLVVAEGVLSGRAAEAVGDLATAAGGHQAVTRISAGDPDIYVILMDGYARADNLLARFGFDDTPFLDFLAGHGFTTSRESRSNYPETALTLVSMFNMGYLEEIPGVAQEIAATSPGVDPSGSGLFRQAINDNRAFSELRARGYEIVSVGSGFEQLAVRRADTYLDDGGLNSFEVWILNRMPGLTALVQALAPDFVGEQARARLNSSLAALQTSGHAIAPRPRLVFVHLMQPHPPVVFGPHGEPLPVALSSAYGDASPDYATAKERYAGQVAYLNQRVEAAIGDLLGASPSSVIVLMSDHGSRYGSDKHPWASDAESVESFFSARTPGHPGLFGDSPTPVNLFPTLFDTYLGAEFPLQANRSFLSSAGNPLQLTPLSP